MWRQCDKAEAWPLFQKRGGKEDMAGVFCFGLAAHVGAEPWHAMQSFSHACCKHHSPTNHKDELNVTSFDEFTPTVALSWQL